MDQVIDRTILGFLLLTLALYSCKAEDPPHEPQPTVPSHVTAYLEPATLKGVDYISELDTFSTVSALQVVALLYYKENSKATGEMTVNGSPVPFKVEYMGRDIQQNRDKSVFTMNSAGLKIGDVVSFKGNVDGVPFTAISGTISTVQEKCDILSTKWNMAYSSVAKSEKNRVGSKIVHEASAQLISSPAPSWLPNDIGGNTDLHFVDDKLVRVTEYIQITSANRASVLNHLNIRAKKLGLNDAVVMLQDFTLRQPYEWSKGSLNFKIYTENKSGQNYVGIEYTPRQ
jgi:hypothetical protein